MTVPLLLEHFDELISTPDDVEKLNRSILQLAIQGKLVAQNPNEEPANKLLKRIEEEKQKLEIIQSSIKVTEEEKSFALPRGWEWVRWDDVSLQIADVDHKMPDEVDEGIPYVSPRDFKGEEEIAFSTAKKISRKDYDDLAVKIRPERGDIIFPRYGTIGVNRFVSVDFEFLASYSCAIVKHMKGLMNPRYVYFYSISPFLKQETQKYINKTTQANVGIKSIQKFVFPLPPLAEQQRIVARVEELFAQTRLLAEQLSHSRTELDHLNESALAHLLVSETPEEFNERWCFIAEHFDLLTEAPEHIAPLRQSILELAVRGKLTRQETGDEPASELIKKTRKEHKTNAVPISKDQMRYELPTGWEWVRFGELGDRRLGKMLDNSKNKGEYYPYLRNLNVQWLRIDLSDVNQMRFERDEIDEYKLRPDDLLICEGGEPGRCAIWQGTELMMFQKAIHRVRPYYGIVSKYLLYHLWADAGNGILEKYFTGATIKHLTGKALAQYICALPPVSEQERIVKRVEQLLGWCDALEAQLKSAEEERGRLVESVLVKMGKK